MADARPQISPAGARRRLLACALAAGVLVSGLGVASASAAQTRTGSLQVCVRGTQGHMATIKISRRGEAVRSFRLVGCTTRNLPVAKYRITETAPGGYRTFSVSGSSGPVGSGNGQISAAYARRVRPAKRTVAEPAYVEFGASPTITFSVRRAR